MNKRLVAAALAVLGLAGAAHAQPSKGGSPVEDGIRARVEQRLNAKPDTVTRMPFGLYEIVIGTELFYVDQEVNYALVGGRAIDLKTRDDLTAKKRDELLKVDFKSLYRDLAGLKNVTIYTFLYPILSQDSFDKSKAVWCAKDRARAWDDLMVNGKAAPAAAADCKNPLQQNVELGRKLEITGTPTIVFTDGRRLPGAVPLDRIEAIFKEIGGK